MGTENYSTNNSTETVYWIIGSDSTTFLCESMSVFDKELIEIIRSEKELIRIENAIKATKTMVTLMRMYEDAKVFGGFARVFKRVKPMFSNSGYLPKRIRGMKCSRD